MRARRLLAATGYLAAALLGVTLAVATASYLLVETPIRHRRLPFTRAPDRTAVG